MAVFKIPKRPLLAALFTLALLFAVGCGKEETVHHITSAEAEKLMTKLSNAVIIDVREPDEYEKKHIKGAILVPLGDLRDGNFGKLPGKKTPLFVYCWTGRRSSDAADILAKEGYTTIYEIGGLVEWTGPTEGEE